MPQGQLLGKSLWENLEKTIFTDGKPDSRQRWTSQFLHQAIVAPASDDGVLSTQALRNDFEHRSRVVVESPDQSRLDSERQIVLAENLWTVSKCVRDSSVR